MVSARQNLFSKENKEFPFSSYWVIALFLFLAFFAWQRIENKRAMIRELEQTLKSVRADIQEMMYEKEDLLLQIQSQNDPKWIELILMRRLGLVPEGQSKIYFRKSTS